MGLAAAFTLVGRPGDVQQIGRGRWDILEVVGQHIPRFESGYIKVGERFYLVGGRQAPQPVEVFDVATRTWKAAAVSPVTMHHFQPVVCDGKIYVLGALTGSGRGEPPLPDVHLRSCGRPLGERAGRPEIVCRAVPESSCMMA